MSLKNLALTLIITIGSFLTASSQTLYGEYSLIPIVSGNGYAHYTTIYFSNDSTYSQYSPTYGWDSCCDAMMLLGYPWQPHIYTTVIEGTVPTTSQRISINGLPLLYETIHVPFGIHPGTTGEYTIEFTEINTIPQGVDIVLQDILLDVSQDLRMDSVYTTWSDVDDKDWRFVIHFDPTVMLNLPTVDESDICIYQSLNTIEIENINMDNNIIEVECLDIIGKTVRQESYNSSKLSLDTTSLDGIYILIIKFDNGQQVFKKVIL